eukprot:scpid79187/ scgid35240/ 
MILAVCEAVRLYVIMTLIMGFQAHSLPALCQQLPAKQQRSLTTAYKPNSGQEHLEQCVKSCIGTCAIYTAIASLDHWQQSTLPPAIRKLATIKTPLFLVVQPQRKLRNKSPGYRLVLSHSKSCQMCRKALRDGPP